MKNRIKWLNNWRMLSSVIVQFSDINRREKKERILSPCESIRCTSICFLFIDNILKFWNTFIANFPICMIHYMSCILLTIIRERITGIYRLIPFFYVYCVWMRVCWHGNKNEKYHWCMCEVRNAWHTYWEKRHTRHKHKLVKAVPDEQ